jgi:hypothetical protein
VVSDFVCNTWIVGILAHREITHMTTARRCDCHARRDENGTDIFRPYSRPNSFRGVLIRPYVSPNI